MAAAPGMNRFYVALGVIVLVGAGAIGFLMTRPKTVSIPANVIVQPGDTAGFSGYVKGSPTAPVEITEYADYQCPYCQTLATLQMPTIDERYIKTGRLRWRFRDFPLDQHPHARLAAHSAACADDQKKFWEQHDLIFQGQAEWSAEANATPIFRRYAEQNGLDVGRYDDCMESGKYAGRIKASHEEGVKVGVNSTPTLLVGGRLYQGRLDSDAIGKLVDSLAR